MITVLFWDIDGTLLTTNRAGIYAWEGAVRACTGVACNLETLPTAGLTDHEIGRLLISRFGGAADSSPAAVVQWYETLLPGSLPRRAGGVLPGVRTVLDAAQTRSDVRSFLLTGNTARGAAAKLGHYGLAHYFPDGGAYSDDAPDRPGIARTALARARAAIGAGTPISPVVIGDTPHDIACGHAIGARVIAVATGSYPLEALQAPGPWWAVPELPPPDRLFERLGLAVSTT